MTEGFVTDIQVPGGSKPVRDEITYALATQAKNKADANEAALVAMEAARAYLYSSNTWFGCRWAKGSSNTEGTPIGNLFRLAHMQEVLKIGGYMVKNDHSRKKLHKSDHRHYEDGGVVDFSGEEGHYQWGWGVGIYYAAWSDDNYEYEAFDDKVIPGVPCVYIPVGSRSCAGYAQLDRTNNKLMSTINKTAQFRGGNNTDWDNTYRSLLGKPVTNIGMPTLATYARNNGSMWFTTERVMIYITGALARVFFHNRNIQAAYNATLTTDGLHQGGLGAGADYPSDWSGRGYNPYIDLDCGIEKGDFTGLFSATIKNSENQDYVMNNIPCFMGLKNFYKYLWSMTEDELLICQSDGAQAMYVEERIDGTTFDISGAGSHILVCKGPAHSGWSYIKDIEKEYLTGMPKEVGGGAATYYADGYYNPHVTDAGAVRGAIRLGIANDGDFAGSLCLNGYYAPSVAYAYWGAVLCEFTEPFNAKLTVLT